MGLMLSEQSLITHRLFIYVAVQSNYLRKTDDVYSHEPVNSYIAYVQ